MQCVKKENTLRSQSLTLSALQEDEKTYDRIDTNHLYECILKILIFEYCNEARFKTPIMDDSFSKKSQKSTSKISSSRLRYNKSSQSFVEPKLPTYIIDRLEKRLKLIALKQSGKEYDEMTRRSLLRMYSDILNPTFKQEFYSDRNPEFLVMKFVACANKEVVKIGNTDPSNISTVVFKQANSFVLLLLSLMDKDKSNGPVVLKLEEFKESLNPNPILPSKSSAALKSADNFLVVGGFLKYESPSFRITDMEQGLLGLIKTLFSKDDTTIQRDVFKVKEFVQYKYLKKDIDQVLFYIEKDLGHFSPDDFTSPDIYDSWKERQKLFCGELKERYDVDQSKLPNMEPVPSGCDYYIFPSTRETRTYLTVLLKLYIQIMSKDSAFLHGGDGNFLTKDIQRLINLCSKFWRLDPSSKATALYTAAHLSGVLKHGTRDESNQPTLVSINPESFQMMQRSLCFILEDKGDVDWFNKRYWPRRDIDQWIRDLSDSYCELMLAIKSCLGMIFNTKDKPKFSPYIQLLGDYIESDDLFKYVEETALPKKWEKRLSKTLLKAAECRYADLLSKLPRDDTLNLLHVLSISESIVHDIQILQRRYKSPLLGFLNVSRTSAAIMTGMFAPDSKNILNHIVTHSNLRKELLPYNDVLEIYKSLSEIRSIFIQVASNDAKFQFDLEEFFFPYLLSWVEECHQKISSIVREATKNDDLNPINIEKDDTKCSTSVLDIFALIREFLKILRSLDWQNKFQMSIIYTKILGSISKGVVSYSGFMTEKIINYLEEDDTKNSTTPKLSDQEKRKSGNWLNEVKNVVSSIQNGGGRAEVEEPCNFNLQLCVALNNMSAMMHKLNKLEEILDPEEISRYVTKHDPSSKKKYMSHIFSLRIIRAENLKATSSKVNPYITLIDSSAKKLIAKTRSLNDTLFPEWNEEFEITIPANTALNISLTIWDRTLGTHSICGRALLLLDPMKFEHDGVTQELYLDLDTKGRVLIELNVESEREDAIFVMGRAHRCLRRDQDRCINLIVQKFSRFIDTCFSRYNLKSICGNNGNLKPTQDQSDEAILPLLDYLNINLLILAEFMTKDLLLKIMLAAWTVVLSSADELLLPKLLSAYNRDFSSSANLKHMKLATSGNSFNGNSTWQSAVSSAVANMSSSIGIGLSFLLTHNEVEIVLSWLHFLCFDFFHNNGNGPAIADLKNELYQSLLLIPIYYDRDIEFLCQEVERLSPAFTTMLREKNKTGKRFGAGLNFSGVRRSETLVRDNSIRANATERLRRKARNEIQRAKSDPVTAQTLTEDIILRILLAKGEKLFVLKRLEQREKISRSIVTEVMARAAAEGKFL